MDKQMVSAEDASTAALLWISQVVTRLLTKGVIDTNEANEIAATAVSMCHANGRPGAAAVIEAIQPSCVGVDPVAAALDRGMSVKRNDA